MYGGDGRIFLLNSYTSRLVTFNFKNIAYNTKMNVFVVTENNV